MLNRIVIDNFATIEHLTFDLGNKLNVITGETGAGKSVLVTAISTALGDRADTSMVRTGSDRALIQIAGDKNGEDVIISREILSSGKSICKLNGEMATLSQVKDFCKDWVDIHGQYDNQQILNPDNHILITDRYHSEQLIPALNKLSDLYNDYKSAEHLYNELIREEKLAKQQKDYYEFEYNYISKLHLASGEDAALSEQLDLMKNSEKIFSAVNRSYTILHEDENSVLTGLNHITQELSSIGSYSDNIALLSQEIDNIYYQLEDVSGQLRDMTDSFSFSEEDLDQVSERLSVIEDAKRKYSKSVDEIIEYMEELDKKLNIIQNFDEEKRKLEEDKNQKYQLLFDAATHVSELRHVIAEHLEAAMIQELKDLDFANSEFKIQIEKSEEIGPIGYDQIEFLISTNPGEPLMPLTKIASGGEISRIMLAFKHILGDSDAVETMIFDEIDTGISGKTALTVGRKMKEIAEHHQILCITHLPQIAAYGEDNYLISKDVDDSSSHTLIKHLDSEEKIGMIATLFSGSTDANALEAARELIEKSH